MVAPARRAPLGALLLDYIERQDAATPDRTAALHEQAQHFAEQGAENPFLDVWFADAHNGYVVGAFGLIFHTVDAGETWQPWCDAIDNPSGLAPLRDPPCGARHLHRRRTGSCCSGSITRLARFEKLELPYKGTLFRRDRRRPLRRRFGLRGTVLRSTDRGAAWQNITHGPAGRPDWRNSGGRWTLRPRQPGRPRAGQRRRRRTFSAAATQQQCRPLPSPVAANGNGPRW